MNNLVTFLAGHAVFLTSKCIFDTCLVNCSASGARLKQMVQYSNHTQTKATQFVRQPRARAHVSKHAHSNCAGTRTRPLAATPENLLAVTQSDRVYIAGKRSVPSAAQWLQKWHINTALCLRFSLFLVPGMKWWTFFWWSWRLLHWKSGTKRSNKPNECVI